MRRPSRSSTSKRQRLAHEGFADRRQMVELGQHVAGDRLVFGSLGIGTPILSANSSTGIQPETRYEPSSRWTKAVLVAVLFLEAAGDGLEDVARA